MRKRNSIMTGLVAMSLLTLPVFAQQAPSGGSVAGSTPGKAAAAQTVKASAVITAIDKTTRTVTMKRADGQSFDIVCPEEVRNFDQLKVGDEVVAQYVRALTMEVRKGGGKVERTETTDAVKALKGAKPGAAAGRQITVTAEVIAVDAKKQIITVKGPKGNVVELDVRNPDHFKVVKKGDLIDAVYTEAVAVTVEPAAKKAAKK